MAQADTIVPPGVQGLDRYAYTNNNPVRYTDPTGHTIGCYDDRYDDGPQCAEDGSPSKWYYDNWKYQDSEEVEELKEELKDYGEIFASVLYEPADWAISINYCLHGDCSPWMLLGFLPFIPSSAGRHADNTIDLFRAVSRNELNDIFGNKVFRPKPGGGSFDAKLFWLNIDSARGFAEYYNLSDIVKVTVSRDVFEHASQTWSNLDQLGPAAGWIDEGLDYFNDAIVSIAHVWSR